MPRPPIPINSNEVLDAMDNLLRSATKQIIDAIRGEFNEMPGMRLTHDQFCRLWHLERQEAERVISSLTASGFLRRDGNNRYGRAGEGAT
jgi:DNA-binding IclR family transcriptional regulator